MTFAETLQTFDQLPAAPASSVKKEGWHGIMRTVAAHGKLLITNHSQPEAVILSTAEYTKLLKTVERAQEAIPDPLEALRKRFDERLAVLKQDDAGARLRALMKTPGKLNGQVKAGSSF
jgi:prevent-host-death family protein